MFNSFLFDKRSFINFPVCLLTILVMASCASDDKQKGQEKTSSVDSSKIASSEKKTILFFGNSLTAGYGVEPEEAFPALVQNKLDSMNLPYTVVNAGVSGETSSGGLSRIDWILKQSVDVFVLELGANDGLRGIPLAETKKNLQAIIDKVKSKNPRVKVLIAGMQIPPNMGQVYISEFRTIYPELAEDNKTAIIPFLLEKVGGEEELNQPDGIHPTAEGHKILAENVWKVLLPLLDTIR